MALKSGIKSKLNTNQQLTDELTKLTIRKFQKQEVY